MKACSRKMLKNGLAIFLLLCVMFLSSCADQVIYLPAVSILSPSNNSTIHDTAYVQIEVNAAKINRVVFLVDDKPNYFFYSAPYYFTWICSDYADGSTHTIEAVAYDNDGNAYPSGKMNVNIFHFSPSSLNAVLSSPDSVKLKWQDNCSYESGFQIELGLKDSLLQDISFHQIAEVDSNVTSYKMTGIFDRNKQYYFRVRARAKDKLSRYSNIVQASVLFNAPEIFSLQYLSDTTAELKWKDNSGFENSFSIYEIKNGISYLLAKVGANITSAQIKSEFINYKYYDFKISADDISSSVSSYAYSRPFVIGTLHTLKAQESGNNKVFLTWKNSTVFSGPVKIERRDASSAYREIGSANSSQFEDSNLDTSRSYFYRVKISTRLNTVYSDEINVSYSYYLSEIKRFRAPSAIASFDISRDNSFIAMGGYTTYGIAVYRLDAITGAKMMTYFPQDSLRICEHVSISNDNNIIAGGGNANRVNLWNTGNGSFRTAYNLNYYTGGLLFHPSKNYLITSTIKKLGVWDYVNNVRLHNINSPGYIASLSFSKNGELLAAAGENGIMIISMSTGAIIKTLPGTSIYAVFLDDDNTIASTYYGKITIWKINEMTSNEFSLPNTQMSVIKNITGSNNLIFTSYNIMGIVDHSTGKIIFTTQTQDEYTDFKIMSDNQTVVSHTVNNFVFRKLLKHWASE